MAALSCGPSKVTHGDLNSRGGETPVPNPNYLMAECNRIEINAPSVRGQISTYYSGGQLVTTYLNVNLTTIPSQVLTTDTYYLQLYRWSERTSGQPSVNQVPVTMYFVMKTSGSVSNPSGSNKISKSVLQSIISSGSLGNYGVSLSNFFERHYVVLTGMDLSYDAVKVALYNSASGTAAISTGDVLLPAFYSNPNVYIAANPVPSLYQLHPNYSYRSANASENDYFAMTEQICAGFFSRIPASLDVPSEGFFGTIQKWIAKIRTSFREALSMLKMGKRI